MILKLDLCDPYLNKQRTSHSFTYTGLLGPVFICPSEKNY